MGTIRIEYVPIQRFNLGLFGLDHIQLVYQDETDAIDSQDYWFVLEGIQDGPLFSGTLGSLGENGRTSLGVANLASRDELIAKIGTPETRGSRIIKSGPDALTLWDRMAHYGGGIDSMDLPYIAASWPFGPQPTINSTSFVASVLYSIGVDITYLMPFGIRNTPGAATLIGTPDNDHLTTTPNFTQLVAGAGDDDLTGINNRIFVEKLYGGKDNDTIHWSYGENIVHGGQPRLAYTDDGFDTVDYSGAGVVHIIANNHPVDHKVATYVATFDGGSDQLFSIEGVTWDKKSDHIIAGEGVDLLEMPLLLDLKGNGGGRGDELGLNDSNDALLINAVDDTFVSIQTISNAGEDAGYWVKSVEWLTGSHRDDQIYANASVLGLDGAEGDDLLDGRLAAPFSGKSPDGYDIELYGGKGDDTLVSGAGRTLAQGGQGSDIFVLSAMSSGAGTVEFVIDAAEADDKLYVPYDFFKIARGDYDGSQLFQLTGGPFKIDQNNPEVLFRWALPADDQVHGKIEFVGLITFTMDGADLLISLYEGHPETFVIDYGPGEPPGPTVTLSVGEDDTLTKIRVRDWSEGDLGLTFPLTLDNAIFNSLPDGLKDYPGYEAAIDGDTDASHFIAPLDDRPEAHLPSEFAASQTTTLASARSFAAPLAAPVTDGTEGDDILFATGIGPYHFAGNGGNDDITGSIGGDVLDGGTGSDTLRGGRGNDTYYVDSASDVVIEDAHAGFDRVISSIDYTLGDNVEHLRLAGNAIYGTGNALRNTLEGNDLNNVLSGGDGNDTLAGNGGDDTLIGGNGGDGYVYENGDGRDVIIETANASQSNDVLIFAGTLHPDDVTFVRNPNAPSDLILSLSDGGRITILNYFAGSGAGIETIEFTTGTKWTASDVAVRAAVALVMSNEAPIALDDSFVYRGDGPFTIPLAAIIDNDRDFDGDALSLLAISNVIGGTAVIDANGNVLVTPITGASDTYVSFDYTISDTHGGTAHATFNVSVQPGGTPVNDAPVATPVTLAAMAEDSGPRLITSAQLLAGVTDADGPALSITALTLASGLGALVNNANGTWTYTPALNDDTAVAFTYTASDGSLTATSTATLDIIPVNDAPVATPVTLAAIAEDSGPRLITSAQLLAGVTDADGPALSITSLTLASGLGALVNNANGTWTYTPALNDDTAVAFNYTASDGSLTATSTATLDITPVNDAPVAFADSGFSVREEKSLKIAAAVLLQNDRDPDGDQLHLTAVSNAVGGTVTRDANGDVIFKAKHDFSGNASFTYQVSDGHGGTSSAKVSIKVVDDDNDDHHHHKIIGTPGRDVLHGTAGDDIFYGKGGNDTFVFTPASGHDEIRDFEIGNRWQGTKDVLDLRGNGITSYSKLWALIHQAGDDTVITLDNHTSITLENVRAEHLMHDNFKII